MSDDIEPIRVVIVDDHAVVRSGLEQFLAIAGDIDVVATAADGNEALACIDEHRPDVVLMDLSMPELDGVEATRRITEMYPSSRVLVLTSFSDQTRIMDALGAGGSAGVSVSTHGGMYVAASQGLLSGPERATGSTPDEALYALAQRLRELMERRRYEALQRADDISAAIAGLGGGR